ncbi:MAG: tetratricopeptide repeat protein [Candidatus Hermodarchaeota archaeon]
MTAQAIKELLKQGKYQAGLDLLSQREADGTFDTFTEKQQIECIYYKSYALYWGLGQREEALQIILAAREKYTSPNDRSLLLVLLNQQIFMLCKMARVDEALEVIKEGDAILESLTAKERETGAYWIAFFKNRKAAYYYTKKDWNTALEYYQRALASGEEIGESSIIMNALYNSGLIYAITGEYDTALDYIQRNLDLGSENVFNFICIGAIYLLKGELDTALNYYQQALSISEKSGNPRWIGHALGFITGYYCLKGELDIALEYNHRFLSLAKKTGNSESLAGCFLLFAYIYYLKGELETALDYIQQNLAFRGEISEPDVFGDPILLSAWIYHAQGELDTALKRLQQRLSEEEHTGNDHFVSATLFSLIRVVLDQNNHFQAQKYLKHLQQLQGRTPNPWIHFHSRLAEALVLKQSPRAKDKFQAQNILEKLVKEDLLAIWLTALAIIHLCDLLIGEVKLYGELDVWKEAKALIDNLYVMAQDQKSVSLICEALLFRAKFAAIDKKLSQALQYYEQARLIATEKNLPVLLAKVDTEQKRFETEFETWQNLIQSNVSLKERLKHARMDDYIKEVQQILKMDLPREL